LAKKDLDGLPPPELGYILKAQAATIGAQVFSLTNLRIEQKKTASSTLASSSVCGLGHLFTLDMAQLKSWYPTSAHIANPEVGK
jgi:hypothetical protein